MLPSSAGSLLVWHHAVGRGHQNPRHYPRASDCVIPALLVCAAGVHFVAALQQISSQLMPASYSSLLTAVRKRPKLILSPSSSFSAPPATALFLAQRCANVLRGRIAQKQISHPLLPLSTQRPANYPEDYFARVELPQRFIKMVIRYA